MKSQTKLGDNGKLPIPGNRLLLKPLEYFESKNGEYTLEMQQDGNLVIYVCIKEFF